jgi:hypothetical protein
MEIEIRINEKQRLAYIRKDIVAAFGLRLRFQPNTNAAIVYANGVKTSDVIRSVELLLAGLKIRADREEKVSV